MRVSKYRGDWKKRVFRVTPDQRFAIVEIATALNVTADGAARLAVRFLAQSRGLDLPGWEPVTSASILAFAQGTQGPQPRTWMHFRESWLPVFEQLRHDDSRTFGSTVREAITAFHEAGAQTWRAALSTPA